MNKDQNLQPADYQKIAKDYETSLLLRSKNDLNVYREMFRKDLVALKNPDTGLLDRLIHHDLSGAALAELPPDQLYSAQQREENERLRERELRNSITRESFPEVTNEVKDTLQEEQREQQHEIYDVN